MDRDEILLTHPGSAKPKYLHLRLDACDLRRKWWTGTGKAQERVNTFGHPSEARRAMEKLIVEKMRDGYAMIRDIAETEPGGVVFQGITRAENGRVCAALHPDGHTAAIGLGVPDRSGIRADVQIHTVDLRTGVRRVIYTGTGSFPYLRTIAFEPDGSHVTSDIRGLGPGPEATYRVEVATGQAERRPYVQPSWNTVRSRVLALGVDDDVPRVFGADGETLLELPAAPKRHCTHATLSLSGRLAAVARYAADGGEGCTLGVWDVDSGSQLLDVPFPYPSDLQDHAGWFQRLEFDASEKILVASTGPGTNACFGVSVETGDLCWTVEDPELERGRYQEFGAVVLSPDRTLLAGVPCGSRPILVCDVATGQRLAPAFEVPGGDGSPSCHGVSFSGDGRLLAVAGYPGLVTVFRLDGPEFTKA